MSDVVSEPELWRVWLEMARESEAAATTLLQTGQKRAAASRFYYAAFQATTALFHYLELTPPIQDGVAWEHWGHDKTPDLLTTNTGKVIPRRNQRQNLRSRLMQLYKLRLYADYVGSYTGTQAVEAGIVEGRRSAMFVVKVIADVLPRG